MSGFLLLQLRNYYVVDFKLYILFLLLSAKISCFNMVEKKCIAVQISHIYFLVGFNALFAYVNYTFVMINIVNVTTILTSRRICRIPSI